MTDKLLHSHEDSDHLGAVEVANHLLERFGAAKRIQSIKECGDEYFIVLYEALTGEPLDGVIRHSLNQESKARNCQLVIDALAKDVLDTDLSHIQGKDITDGNVASVGNLLEIFMDLLECVFEELQREEADNAEQDSNILSEDHEILSDVIQKEFGTLHSSLGGSGKQVEGKRNLDFDKYLVEKRHPTRDDDLESQSNLDFTADSLFSIEGRKTVLSRPDAASALQMPPFAYFSSSSGSNSTEDLTKEALAYQKQEDPSSVKDADRSSSLNVNKTLPTRQTTHKIPKTNPALTSTRTSQKNAKQASVESSSTSGSWPSILSANELNSSVQKASLYTERDQRPKAPFSSDNCSDRSDSSQSVVHKHTHHHYYYSDSKDASKGIRSKPPTKENILKSSQHASSKSNQARSLDVSKQTKLVSGDLIGQDKHQSNDPLLAPVEANSAIGGLPKQSHSNVVEKSWINRSHDVENRSRINKSLDASRTTEESRRNVSGIPDRSRNDIATNTSNVGIKDTPTCDAESIRVRSVQTSVSDMPVISERSSGPPGSSAVSQLLDTNRSVHSSVSELNDLLNKQSRNPIERGTRFDVLQELEKRLQEVRASVAKIDAHQIDETDSTEGNIRALRGFLENDNTKSSRQSLLQGRLFRRQTDSVCSDSEFDYGQSVRENDINVAERDYGLSKRENHQKKQRNATNIADTSSNEDDNLPEIQLRPKKRVAFKDIEKESRDERLERLVKLLKTEEKESENALANIKGKYNKDFRETRAKQTTKSKENKPIKVPKEMKKTQLQQTTPNKSASRLARIYGARSRKPDRCTSKPRKRSASCSPVARARRKGRLVLEEEDILPLMEEEFPHLYLSPATAKMMWHKQMHQLSNLTKASQLRKPTKIQKQIEDSKKKQEALMKIMKKEMEHNKRLKDEKEKSSQQRQVTIKLRERRLASARARRYYDEYQVRMRARMLKRRTKEERIFKDLFEDALDIQKQRVREMRRYAREQRDMDAKTKQNELESMENFYRDRFSMMADSVARERYELQVRQKAQSKVAENMRKAIRERMENDIRALQEELVREEDSTYFRQLDAENLKKEFQLATYKSGAQHL